MLKHVSVAYSQLQASISLAQNYSSPLFLRESSGNLTIIQDCPEPRMANHGMDHGGMDMPSHGPMCNMNVWCLHSYPNDLDR